MKQFTLIFRTRDNSNFKPSPEQMQEILNDWSNWMGSIAAQDKLADRGNRLSVKDAKTVNSNNTVTDGPYTEIKEFINGYIIVKTNDVDEAVALAKGCPILKTGGNVEVRTVVSMDDNS